MKKYAKTALCIALSAAMVFSNTEMTAFAEENTQAEDAWQEVDVEQTEEADSSAEEEMTQEAPVRETAAEQVSEDGGTAEDTEEISLIENDSDEDSAIEERTADEDVQDISSEEELTEKTEVETVSNEETVSEDVADMDETETASVTETEVEETENKLTFSDTDIAHGEYKENGSDITWVIDADGKLTVEGTGNFRTPWGSDNATKIKSAVINVKGATSSVCMLQNCSNLTSVDLSGFDTSTVTDMSSMFSGCSSLTSLDVSNFDTSKVTDMSSMFSGCSSLTSLDVSNFDTGNVTGMYCMFRECSSLTDLDVSNFDTSNVKNMNYMFEYCSNLTNLDVSNFDTSKVTYMERMFSYCSSLTSLDVSNFDTGNVTGMYGVFRECSSLTDLDVSNFDTGNVTNMAEMFYNCKNLTSIDVSNFDTSSVTNMGSMFWNCSSLPSLDVSNFDTSSVTGMKGMFLGCSSLADLDVSNFDTSSVTSMGSMFSGCSSLPSLNVSNFDTSSVTSMGIMFSGCSSLADLDVSNFDTSSVTDMGIMFSGCSSLPSLNVSNFDTSSVTDMGQMFSGCSSLPNLDVNNFDTSSVTDMGWMFSDCSSLPSLDVSNFDTSSVTDMHYMFEGCSSLPSLDVSNFDTSSVTDMGCMFRNCSNLMSLNVSSFDTSSVTDMQGMFWNCSSLPSLDVSNFDTSSVTDMYYMFLGCSSLPSLDVSRFDTSSVTDMGGIFNGCSNLPSLDVSNFDTGSATKIGGMFGNCSNLTSLDLSSFNTSSVTDMGSMFSGCSSLTSLDLSSFNTSSVTNMVSMFLGCSSLTSLDLSSFDVKNVRNHLSLTDCSSLIQVYLPRNLERGYALPTTGTWYDMEGNTYSTSPTTGENSILLCRDAVPQAPVARIVVKKVKTSYACGETPNTDDITVLYYGADATARVLAETQYTTNAADINMDTAGEKILTVTYRPAEGSTLTADIRLSVGTLLDDATVTVTLPDTNAYNYIFDRKTKKPTPTVVYNAGAESVTLTENVDYTVSYKNNKNAYQNTEEDKTSENAPTVIITGCGSYTGKVTKNFEIQKAAAPAAKEIVTEFKTGINNNVFSCSVENYFTKYGSITGYTAETPIEDDTVSGNVLKGEVSVSLSGSFICSISETAVPGDFVTVPVTISFVNYEDAVLNVKIVIMGDSAGTKKKVTISGIEVKDSVYNKTPVSYTGTAKVTLDTDNTDLTNTVKLTYTYSGTQADGSSYAASAAAPVNAGSYKLTVAVAADNADYTGSQEYSFKVTKAPLVITARDMGLKIGADLPKEEDYQYDTAGLLEGDKLTAVPKLACSIADTAQAGTYDITVSDADAGMNYEITYQNGTLTVSETGESAKYYTVTFDMNGHGNTITNTGVKEGSLLEKPQNPQAAGYTFTGWYKDQSCTVLWDFEKDMVQSDTIIYAGWTIDGTGGGDNTDMDDSPYEDSERIDLKSVNAAIANIKAKVYDGNAYEPVVKVTATIDTKKVTLTEGTDYRVLYMQNVNAGTGTVIVRGNGEYKGEITKDFTISKKPVKKLKILTGSIVGTATKQAASDVVYVYDGAKRLVEGADYELSEIQPVKNKTDVVQVTVKGTETGNYSGESAAKKINVYEAGTQIITPDCVTLDKTSVPYTGKAINNIAVTVTVNGNTLNPKTDYKVQFQNNKDAGTAYIVVTGKKAYQGTVIKTFTITAETVANASDFTIKEIKAVTYNGKLQKPAISVTFTKSGKSKKLSKKDYTVAYRNNLHAGEATVIVTGKGNYAGLSATANFTIKPQQIKKASLKGTQNNLVLTYSKRKLKEGTDYEKPEYGEVNKNKIPVTVKGRGDFTGEMTKTVKVQ